MTDKDPLVSAWFGIEMQGAITGAFRECTGLGSESQLVEYKASAPDGKYVLKHVPGRMKYNDVTLKRGITDSMDMWEWRKMVEDGDMTSARKNGSIMMFDQAGMEIARWDLTAAWPTKISGPTANAGSNDVGIEEIVITHEGYKRTK